MGLIKAGMGAIGSTMADQWVDFFTCNSMTNDILVKKGTKNVSNKSSNTKGNTDIITNGSKINVADGQCMLIVEDGKVIDFCAEPGQYSYNNEIAPSMLSGGFKDLGRVFKDMGKRFTAGGDKLNQQRIYYINTKEITGNKLGWGNIQFRDFEFQLTVRVQGYGQYSFRVSNALLFYTNVVGNIQGEYRRDDLVSQMKSEILSALNPALGKIAQQGIPYDMLINYPREIGKALSEEMSAEWTERRGIEIISLSIESLTVDDASAKKIEQLQEARALSNPMLAAGRIVAGQVNSMEIAAGNKSGAMTGFMGMNMAQQSGGINANSLFQIGQTQNENAMKHTNRPNKIEEKEKSWTCKCGECNTGKFCQHCGAKEPINSNKWKCVCGQENKGKFCAECGAKKVEKVETDRIKCKACDWIATDTSLEVKFCPECGTRVEV